MQQVILGRLTILGGVVFNVLDQSDVTATLDINIKQQPHLTQIRFVPASALGTNTNIGGEPYYTFGDIVKLTEGDNTSYWICARPCSQLKRKGKSHWLSLNLNKLGSEKSNFTKFSKSGFYDYILPTDLGNEAGSLEHLQNLIKVLAIIDDPANAKKMSLDTKGLGGLPEAEFDNTKRKKISTSWAFYNYWQTILPSFFSRKSFQNCLYDDQSINVFYHGHSYYDKVDKFLVETNPSVWMAKINPTTFQKVSSGLLKWTRTPKAVDFSDTYAEYGGFIDPEKGLPETGLIVRYKTGAQLVGKSGDDEAPLESFTEKHNDMIEDVFVYGKEKSVDVIMGDQILSDSEGDQICVVSPSESNSYYATFISSFNENATYPLSETAIPVYFHVLNAVMQNCNLHSQYAGLLDGFFPTSYLKAINYLYENYKEIYNNERELSQDVTIKLYSKKDKLGNRTELTNANTFKDLELFTILFPYKESRSSNAINIAALSFNLRTREYHLQNYATNNPDKYKQSISIKEYRTYKGALKLNSSQNLARILDGNIKDREEIRITVHNFYENAKIK